MAEDLPLSGGDVDEAKKCLDKSRFSRTIGAKKANRTVGYVEVYLVKSDMLAVILG